MVGSGHAVFANPRLGGQALGFIVVLDLAKPVVRTLADRIAYESCLCLSNC